MQLGHGWQSIGQQSTDLHRRAFSAPQICAVIRLQKRSRRSNRHGRLTFHRT
jgi:hypothetical protein